MLLIVYDMAWCLSHALMKDTSYNAHKHAACRQGHHICRTCFATSGAAMMACHALSVNSFCVMRLPPPPPPPPVDRAVVASARRPLLQALQHSHTGVLFARGCCLLKKAYDATLAARARLELRTKLCQALLQAY